MNIVLSVTIGVLVFAGIYQLLARELFRISFGIYLLFNAVNVLLLSMAASLEVNAPLGQLPPPHADPLVQAMALTAIVIGIAISTLILMLTACIARQRATLDRDDVRHWRA